MSLDDESPTQYFGPDAVTFTALGTGGRTVTITMTQGRARHLIAEGVPAHKFTGLIEEPAGHTPGCANARTGKCLCTYLAQWDSKPAVEFTRSPELQELHEKQQPALQLPLVIATDCDNVHALAEKIVRQNPEYFGYLPADPVYKPGSDAEQRLSDEKLRTEYWHKEYKAARRGFWAAVAFAAVCATGLGTVLAWAGVL